MIPTKPLTPSQVAVTLCFYAPLLLSGNLLIPIIIGFAARYKTICWSPLFLNFWLSWIAYCVSFLLVFYSGDWNKLPKQPPRALCEMQSVWTYVSPIFAASTTVSLLLKMWLSVHAILDSRQQNDLEKAQGLRQRLFAGHTRLSFLLWFPHVTWVLSTIVFIGYTKSHRDLVRYKLLFCALDFQPVRTAVSIYTGISAIIVIICQIDVGWRVYKHREELRHATVEGWPLISFFVRSALWMTLSSGVIIAASLAVNNMMNDQRKVLQAMLPLFTFLIFGTNKNVYKPAARQV